MKSTESFMKIIGPDLYFICQMIDKSLDNSMNQMRQIDEFMGDTACIRLLENYPKYTPLHQYIEYVVESVIWEDYQREIKEVISLKRNTLWVDYLLDAHKFDLNIVKWHKNNQQNKYVDEYLIFLNDSDILNNLLSIVSKEVFHVIFSNKKVLHNFAKLAAVHIIEIAPSFYPEKLTSKGYLKRATIPIWVKNTIFHRDKGICTNCKTDLTRLINMQGLLHFDHIVPLSQGGMNDVTNLQVLCSSCNLKKSSRHQCSSFEYESWYQY